MGVRETRLTNDLQQVSELIANSGGSLKLISKTGNPPYEYVIEYRCKGIETVNGNNPVYRNTHQVKIILGTNYPREKPDAKFLTPIFHPNVFSNQNVCLGNYWTPGETVTELILRIGKIIQYSKDVLNLKSPANGTAKTWASNNMSRFPVDTQTLKVNLGWTDIS
jgi:ubiquitin-protein ligase